MDDLQEEAICARIQKARKETGLSQTEFAELLEVIPRTVQNYESNRVPWSKMGKIGDITGKSTRWLLHGEDAGAEHVETDIGELTRKVTEMSGRLEELLSRMPPVQAVEQAIDEAVERDAKSSDSSDASSDSPHQQGSTG